MSCYHMMSYCLTLYTAICFSQSLLVQVLISSFFKIITHTWKAKFFPQILHRIPSTASPKLSSGPLKGTDFPAEAALPNDRAIEGTEIYHWP